MKRFIVMTCGYAEGAYVSGLIYQCEFFGNPGYLSYEEAITDLALDLYAKFYDDYISVYQNRYDRDDLKQCCRATLLDKKDAKFCCQCGQQIADREFNYDEFLDYVRSLHTKITDTYGDAEWANSRGLVWWPYGTLDIIGAPKEDVICIAEGAEDVILTALLDAKPELVEQTGQEFQNDDWEMFKAGKPPTYR
jgi:hypothetical protein